MNWGDENWKQAAREYHDARGANRTTIEPEKVRGERKAAHKAERKAKSRKGNAGAEHSRLDAEIILDPRDPMHSARELVAARFTDIENHRLLHHHRGAFWRFQANHYAPAEPETIRTAAWTFLENAKQIGEKNKTVPFKPNRARVSDLIDALTSVCNLNSRIEPPAWLNGTDEYPAAEMFPVANGLLHLLSGELYEPTPSYFGLSASDVAFNPDAPEPAHWHAFLADLFGSDNQAVATLQDWFGYALTPDTSQQKILLIVGPRRSGKGTIARVITAMLGRDSVTAPTLAGLQSNFGLAPLIGKPLAIISDARLGGKSDQAVIAERLLSISGEDGVTIDRKFMPVWTGRLPTRFMVLTNELPRIADSSGALAGRFIVLVLEHSFYGHEDLGLAGRLLAELPGIFNWALVGCRRLRQRGYFIQPPSAGEAVEELEALGSPIKAYVRERCHVGPGHSIPAELLYQDYRAWCESNGRREPGTKQTFGRDLKAAVPGVRTSRPRDAGERFRQYEGITLEQGGSIAD
jgi:putative DNA primase/helicase